jgi:hypothetical protein
LEASGKALDECDAAAAVYFSATYLIGSRIEGVHPVPVIRFADKRILADNPWLEKFHGTSPTCCLFRKDAFSSLGGYRTSLRLAYDWDLYMRFMTAGSGVAFLPQVLCIYRKHEEQMVQGQSLDGLYDMLDLWPLEEYSHWPAWELADLVLSQMSLAIRNGGSIARLIDEVRRRRLGLRILAALPNALWRKYFSGNELTGPAGDLNYEVPGNVDSAMRQAAGVLQTPVSCGAIGR